MNNQQQNKTVQSSNDHRADGRGADGLDARALGARVDALADLVSALVGKVDKLAGQGSSGGTGSASSGACVAVELGSAHSDWSEEVEAEEARLAGVAATEGLAKEESASSVAREEELVEAKPALSVSSGGSVVMPAGGPSGAVDMPLFGSVGESKGEAKKGGMATYVKVSDVIALRALLASHGIELSRKYMPELAMARYAAGAMPSWFIGGKERVRVLAGIGDSVLDTVVAVAVYASGGTAEVMSNLRTRFCTDKFLGSAGDKAGYLRYLVVPTGVVPLQSKAGATYVEALVGLVFLRCGFGAAVRLAAALGVVDSSSVAAIQAR